MRYLVLLTRASTIGRKRPPRRAEPDRLHAFPSWQTSAVTILIALYLGYLGWGGADQLDPIDLGFVWWCVGR